MTGTRDNRHNRHTLIRQELRERLMREQIDHRIEERRKSAESKENKEEGEP